MSTSLIKSWSIFGIRAPVAEWILLGLCVLLSLALSVRPDVEFAKWTIQHVGYWQMWLIVGWCAAFAIRDGRCELVVWRRWWRGARRVRLLWVGVLLVGASVFAHIHFVHRFKVLADEATLANTSHAIQQHRLIYTPGHAEHRAGIFTLSEGFIDKRPYFHPFIVSLVHEMTGYRWSNAIWLNGALTPVMFMAFFFLGRRIDRRIGGWLSVGFAAGVPILAQTLTGGGFEPLNLLLILAVTLAALRCWDRFTVDRFGLLLCAGLLLAYTRYESGLYLVPVGLIAWWAWRRAGWGRIPWVLFPVPVLCVPLVWLQRIAFSMESKYFQLSVRNDVSAFSTSYFPGNLMSAIEGFFEPNPVYMSSPLLAVAGGATLVWMAATVGRYWGKTHVVGGRTALVLGVVACATIGNAFIFMFFNYGQYGEYITQRIGVPVWGGLVLATVWLVPQLFRSLAPKAAAVGVAANLLFFYLRAANGDFYRKAYINAKDFDFVRDFCGTLGKEEGVFVYSHMTPVWLALERPCMGHRSAEANPVEIAKVLASGRYNRILIHVFEYSPFVRGTDTQMTQPPVWFDRIEKRLLARRWVAEGVFAAIYEFEGVPAAVPAGSAVAR